METQLLRKRDRDRRRERKRWRERDLTQSTPILRWIPTKGLSSRLEMCSSPSFTILSDHTTYRCRPTCSSTTGNWAGAPGRASTGCSAGGNLQREVRREVLQSSWSHCRRLLTSLLWDLLTSSSTEVDGRHWRTSRWTGPTCQTPHQRSPRRDRMDSHPGKKIHNWLGLSCTLTTKYCTPCIKAARLIVSKLESDFSVKTILEKTKIGKSIFLSNSAALCTAS